MIEIIFHIIFSILLVMVTSLLIYTIIRKNKWKFVAKHDRLTGLYNREEFEKQLVKRMQWVKEHPKYMLIYLMVDLDDFKKINDLKGHKEGDRILKNVAKSLKKHLRKLRNENYFGDTRRNSPKICNKDLLCRYGGEEFSVGIIAERKSINSIIEERFDQACLEGGCKASVGSAMFLPQMDIHVKNLIEKADFAMYKKKRERKMKRSISEEELKDLCPDYENYAIGDDRRKQKRIKVKNISCIFRFVSLTCFKDETNFHGKLIDISTGGLKFLSQVSNPKIMKKHTKIEIEFVLKGQRHIHLVEIRYFDINTNTCGCKFICD